jgi:hypothetical protein
VLWRLDHGGVEGLQPKAIVLMIGNNNMFFTRETGIPGAAKGIQMCVRNLREKFPDATLVLAKILPAHAPGNPFYEDIQKTNAALDELHLEDDPRVRVLNLWGDFVQADGALRKELFTNDNIHLAPAGYAAYAARLKPYVEAALKGTPLPPPGLGGSHVKTGTVPKAGSATANTKPTLSRAASGLVLKTRSVLTYPYAPYNEGKLDPQLTGWPLTDGENEWVLGRLEARAAMLCLGGEAPCGLRIGSDWLPIEYLNGRAARELQTAVPPSAGEATRLERPR